MAFIKGVYQYKSPSGTESRNREIVFFIKGFGRITNSIKTNLHWNESFFSPSVFQFEYMDARNKGHELSFAHWSGPSFHMRKLSSFRQIDKDSSKINKEKKLNDLIFSKFLSVATKWPQNSQTLANMSITDLSGLGKVLLLEKRIVETLVQTNSSRFRPSTDLHFENIDIQTLDLTLEKNARDVLDSRNKTELSRHSQFWKSKQTRD